MPKNWQPWSDEELQYLRKNYRKVKAADIAVKLNRTTDSVRQKALVLGITKKEPKWTKDDDVKLASAWGKKPIKAIAKSFNRTEGAIIYRAYCVLKLGPSKNGFGLITTHQLADALGINSETIRRWIKKHGLKCHRKVPFQKTKFYLIDIDDFWAWAGKNQHRFDSRKFEHLALGKEPEWMTEKRRADVRLAPRRMKLWTAEEEARLKAYFKAGYSYQEIGYRLGRSVSAVGNHLMVIDVWGKTGGGRRCLKTCAT